MANMEHCRFHNTLLDLRVCRIHIEDEELSEPEDDARTELIKLCDEIANEYGSTLTTVDSLVFERDELKAKLAAAERERDEARATVAELAKWAALAWRWRDIIIDEVFDDDDQVDWTLLRQVANINTGVRTYVDYGDEPYCEADPRTLSPAAQAAIDAVLNSPEVVKAHADQAEADACEYDGELQ